VKASDWLHCPFDNPMLPPKNAVRKGQHGKAVGCVPPTALLFEQTQYKISKSKYAVSIIAVTPATEALGLPSLRGDLQAARSSLNNIRLKRLVAAVTSKHGGWGRV
jgi:hypothetical protein